MKKKIGLSIIIFWIIICIVMVYGVGGKIAPWIWNGSIFIVAPIASIALIFQIINLIIRAIRGKKILWNSIFILVTAVVAYPITILFGVSNLTYPIKDNNVKSITIQNPVKEGVLLGGKSYKTHAVWPSECYAYDILKEPYNINSNDLNDYGIYLSDVYCPISGTVIDLKDNEEDILPNTEDFKSSLGNYIIIKVESTGTYLILAHLEKDSLKVSVGDYVTEGEVIAKVGNSGTTSEPHLHIQHQENNPLEMKLAICAEGLPMEIKKN